MRRMNYVLLCGWYFVLLTAALASAFYPANANPQKTCLVPAKNQTIQQAIYDPTCDIVHISAGIHQVNLDVDRQVIIEGEGTAETILDGSNSNEVIAVFSRGTTTGNATIRNLTIQNGRDTVSGGGIVNEAIISVSDVRIINNHGRTGAGILNFGTATLNRVEISGNTASGNGGGVHSNSGGMMTLTNVTISGNAAMGGSGISSSGPVILINSTIYSNTDQSDFATISNYGTITTTHSIVGGGNAINCGGSGAIVSQGHNLADDTSCNMTGNQDQQNKPVGLKPLADNGGPTWTHALLSTSPALDAGDNAICPKTDQRGVDRPSTLSNGKTAVCDIGAFEATPYKIYLPLVVR